MGNMMGAPLMITYGGAPAPQAAYPVGMANSQAYVPPHAGGPPGAYAGMNGFPSAF